MNSRTWTAVSPDFKAHQYVYRLLTDVADLAGYDEPVTAPKYLETLHIAREYIYRAVARDAPQSSAPVRKPPAT